MAVKLELLKTACYFTNLDEPVLSEIASHILERQVSSGESILWEGEQDSGLYFVITGIVRLYSTSVEGRELVIRLVYGGDSFNDESLFNSNSNVLSASSITQALLYKLNKSELETIREKFPKVNVQIAQVFAKRNRYLIQLAEELVFKNVTGRVARLLLEREKLASAGTGNLRITQQDMASMAGTVRELVSRSLKELELSGAIKMERNQIIIKDRRQLIELGSL